ncbi:MAG TPA: hypothetical protein VFI57_05235, partial [Pyrinomonadaceae bacterium]|nr:hypothetical protein [Pyrinomonadaceae bacterium]
ASIYASLDPPQKERALEYHQRAILFAQQHNDRDAQVTAILAKARGIERLEDDGGQSQVNQLYDQAVALYDDPASKINTTVRIGKSILGIKRDDETIAKAQQYFQAAINLAQQQADKKIAATAYMEIGVAYRLPSRAKATDYFQKALTIYQAEGDLYGQAMALYRLSSVSSATKSLELAGQALPIFDRVLPTLQASDKQVELAEAYSAMGFLYRRKKEFPASLDSFNRALAIYKTLQRLSDQKSRIRNVENLIRTTQRLKDGTN